MCIRDSIHGADVELRAVAREERLVSSTFFTFQHVHLAHEPVSYTHLRAHETVLDLVCRLLLEKKKTKTYYIN